jgi:hypothetical protein
MIMGGVFPDSEQYRADDLNSAPRQRRLLHLLATTLNQNDQQNDSNSAGDDPDDCCIAHVSSPFVLLKKPLKKAF